ncbi:MAG: hypothetical protein LH471_12035 [Salinibacterium sp.]|nr:hypothetical protein [Salinibacterium sp.]
MALKASPETQATLLELQRLDTKITQLDHRAKTLPQLATIAATSGEASIIKSALAERTGIAENTSLELSRIEADVAVVEARIARDSERLQSTSSVKDVAALEQELSALRKRLNDLEEIELAVMERLETEQLTVAATRSQLADSEARLTESSSARDVALADLTAERTSATSARQSLAAGLPADLLALYEKQRSRYGTGASLLRGGVSQASGVALLEDELQKIRAAEPDDVLLCPSSDAILVRTGESGLERARE